MIHSIKNIGDWEPGDSIDVAGTLCQNPKDAWITHIGNFYGNSEAPIESDIDAKLMLRLGWVSLENWELDELSEFLDEYRQEIRN